MPENVNPDDDLNPWVWEYKSGRDREGEAFSSMVQSKAVAGELP